MIRSTLLASTGIIAHSFDSAVALPLLCPSLKLEKLSPLWPINNMKSLALLLLSAPLILAQPACPTKRLWHISNCQPFSAYNATSTASYISFDFIDDSLPNSYYQTSCYRTADANPNETGPGSAADDKYLCWVCQ
jgi:hypothetical protein